MDQSELDLLINAPEKLCFMNSLLSQYQFPEDFLIKTIGYYYSKYLQFSMYTMWVGK